MRVPTLNHRRHCSACGQEMVTVLLDDGQVITSIERTAALIQHCNNPECPRITRTQQVPAWVVTTTKQLHIRFLPLATLRDKSLFSVWFLRSELERLPAATRACERKQADGECRYNGDTTQCPGCDEVRLSQAACQFALDTRDLLPKRTLRIFRNGPPPRQVTTPTAQARAPAPRRNPADPPAQHRIGDPNDTTQVRLPPGLVNPEDVE